jgi:Ca2+-binding RTX toxin-like protein
MATSDALADLVVSSVSAPTATSLGASIDVTWTVTNQGSDTTEAEWLDHIYISRDPLLDNSDKRLAWTDERKRSPLAVGSSYTETAKILIPADFQAGAYYLLFVTDGPPFSPFPFINFPGYTQPESDESNNVQAVSLQVAPPPVDLVVSSASTSAATVATDQIFSVSWTVTNQGSDSTQANWYDTVYLSRDLTISDSDLQVFNSVQSNLATPLGSQSSYSKTFDISLPKGLASGNYYLLFATDRGQTYGFEPQTVRLQAETDESNNVRALAINVSGQESPGTLTVNQPLGSTLDNTNSYLLTDLTVGQAVTVSAQADFLVNLQLMNADSKEVLLSSSTFGYTTGFDFTPIAGTNYLLEIVQNFPPLGPNPTFGAGYTLSVTSSSNPSADLVVTAATAPTSATSAGSIQVSWTVTNQGSGAAESDWNDQIWLSLDQVLDAGDIYLDYRTADVETPLATGASYTSTQTIVLPANIAAGNYYLLFYADGDKDYQSESDSTNNVRAVALNLLAEPIGLTMVGTGAGDLLVGSDGDDTLMGMSADDTLKGGIGKDYLKGGSGNDLLEGGSGTNILEGESGDDFLIGGENGDILIGGKGQDTLWGMAGDDQLIGGHGQDWLVGGSGQDQFVYEFLSDRGDQISNFEAKNDVIVLTDLLANLGYSGSAAIADGYLKWDQAFADTRIQIDSDGSIGPSQWITFITLSNFQATNLTANNFVL